MIRVTSNGQLIFGAGVEMLNDAAIRFETGSTKLLQLSGKPNDGALYRLSVSDEHVSGTNPFDVVQVTASSLTAADAATYFEISIDNNTGWGLRARGTTKYIEAYKLADYADKAVYLSADGSDSNDGDLSSRPVKTFARASQLIRDTQLKEIRITGTKPIPVTTAATWSFPTSSGYPEGVVVTRDSLTGDMISVSSTGSLTLQDIILDGASVSNNIVLVEGGSVTIHGGTTFRKWGSSSCYAVKASGAGSTLSMDGGEIAGGMYTDGLYVSGEGTTFTMSGNASISGCRWGVYITTNAAFVMEGGSIATASSSTSANGVYVSGGPYSNATFTAIGGTITSASGNAVNVAGTGFQFDPTKAVINGKIYLGDNGAVVNLLAKPAAGKVYNLQPGSNYSGVPYFGSGSVVVVPAGDLSSAADCASNFVDAEGKYSIGPSGNNLILVGSGVYVDGSSGDDSRNGLTPATAVKTLGAAAQKVTGLGSDDDKIVYVCSTVKVLTDEGTVDFGGATLQRLMMNDLEIGPLVEGQSGGITLQNVTFDGLYGSAKNTGSQTGLLAMSGGSVTLGTGVTLQNHDTKTGPVVVVSGGSLTMANGSKLTNNILNRDSLSTGGCVLWVQDGTFNLQSGASISANKEPSGTATGQQTVRVSGGVCNLSGGSIFGNTARFFGAIRQSGGTINMTGGSIYSNTASTGEDNGRDTGGVSVEGTGVFNMSGGSIYSNKAKSVGGVYVYGDATTAGTFAMSGSASIGTNTATAGTAGLLVSGTLKMAGSPSVSSGVSLQNTERPIVLTGALTGANKYTLALPDTFVGKTVVQGLAGTADAASYLSRFPLSTASKQSLTLRGESPNIVAGGLNIYLAGDGDDTADGESVDTAVKSLSRALTLLKSKQSGAKILFCRAPVEISSGSQSWSTTAVTNNDGATWTPVLQRAQGYTQPFFKVTGGTLTLGNITLDGNASAFTSSTDSIVYIKSGTMNLNSGAVVTNNNGCGVGVPKQYEDGTGTLNISGGTISNNKEFGVVVYGDSAKCVMTSGTLDGNAGGVQVRSGTFTMSGGVIQNSKGTGYSDAAVSLSYKSTFNMSGSAKITNNSAYSSTNGSVIVSSGTFNMSGGQISANKSGRGVSVSGGTFQMSGDAKVGGDSFTDANPAGGVYASGGTVEITGGQISYNYGPGIQAYNTTTSSEDTSALKITLGDGTKIYGNRAVQGAGVYLQTSASTGIDSFKVSGAAEIYNNNATGSASSNGGGGIYLGKNAKFDMTGGKIYGNETAASGGGICVGDATASLTISGGTISNNHANGTTATSGGGGVSLVKGAGITLNGGTISGNDAARSGGGIYAAAGSSGAIGNIQLNGGTISGNTAKGTTTAYGGGGICLNDYTKAEFNGTRITGNTAQYGGGVYLTGSNAEFVAVRGAVTDNTVSSGGNGAGVYVASPGFELQGGGADISGDIYLSGTSYPLQVSRLISQTSRQYEVSLADSFKSGGVVVKPDGSELSSVTAYLKNFYTSKSGSILGEDGKNIVLQSIVFLDGTKTASGDGSTPDKAFNNFAAASAALTSGSTAIYISGPVTVSGTESWTLPTGKSLRRYSGFSVAGKDEFDPYYGDMIVVPTGATLNLGTITIEGRHSQDIDFTATGSIIRLNGGTVNMNAGTTLQNNSTSGNGGAVRIDSGAFNLNAGTIANTAAKQGGAVYQNGTFNVKSAATVSGEVYLGTGKTVGVAGSAGTALSLDMDDAAAARAVVTYTTAPTSLNLNTELAKYTLSDDVAPLYKLARRSTDTKVFELQEKGGIYVDGTRSAASGDGTEPSKAVKTLGEAYQKLAGTGGGTIYVVNPVTVSSTITLGRSYTESSTTYNAGGPVTIKRYSKPAAFTTGSNTGTLINVTGGTLTLAEGLTVDGHSAAVTQGKETVQAPAVTAVAPLISISGGTVSVQSGAVLKDNNNASGNGGAVATSGTGILTMTGGTIANMKAPQGAAIHHSGSALNLSGGPSIAGEVYLNGTGKVISVPGNTIGNTALTIGIDSASAKENRAVVAYSSTPTAAVETPKYTLSEAVSAAFYLNASGSNLVLAAKGAVYLDGVNGLDTRTGVSPAQAVKTLGKAYEKMKSNNANTLYIVNTVTVDSSVELSGRYCYVGGATYDAGAPVTIRRYSKPTNPPTGFEALKNGVSLFSIVDGGTLTLENITIDGHRYAITSGKTSVIAPGIKAHELINISAGGTLMMNEGAVLQNNSTDGAGGGVYNYGAGTVVMNAGSLVTKCTADLNGGGVFVNGGTCTITNAEVSNCEAGLNGTYNGGGVYVSGTLAMTGSTLSENTAPNGAGLYLSSGKHEISNTVFSNNTASGNGGGVYMQNFSQTTTLNRCTYENNTATLGGGIYALIGFEMNGGSFSGNSGGGGGGICMTSTSTRSLTLNGSSDLSFGEGQEIFLGGKTQINVTANLPSGASIPVALDGGDCYLGRPIVVFDSSVTNDATDQLGKFSLAHAEYHTFAFVIRASDKKVIELGYPRSITAQPEDAFVKLGTPASFTITTAGDTPTGYRIFNKTKNAYVAGAILALPAAGDPNTVTVSFTPTLADGAGEYQVEAVYGTGDSAETLRSDPAVLSLWELAYSAGNDALTTSIELASMVPNDAATFTVRSGYNKAMKLGVGSYQYTPDDGFTIDWGTTNYVNPQIYRTTWGSEDAMKNIAFMRHDGTQYMSVSPGDTQMSVDVAANEAHPFKIEVYNANAIAERHTGTLGMNLSLLDGGTETKKAESSAEVKFLMQPAAINATLPLTVQSYGYGADGSVAVPTNYGIQNGSNFPIKVTGLSAEAASDFRLMDPSSFVDGADRTYLVNKNQMSHGQATLRLADQQITTASAGGSWMAGADFTGWAIAGAASEGAWVSYPIAIESYIAKGEDSTTGKQLAQVTYTVGISPESVS
ncbi:hypothetical protein [Anaerotruncus massiliensis (ex Togo et al. 2019)]|uniref:beta strand repeat-containing protein n=2 Tax=Anaerotruncus TaxID=244127 RepID=UPI0027B96B9C|nr:hypothetical protein [Anaerotruncus massiliensis (ex Togo et al. 2019)]